MRLDPILNRFGLTTQRAAQQRVNAEHEAAVAASGPSRTNKPLWEAFDADMRPGRLPYSVLRSYADQCEPLRLCINRVKVMVHSLKWSIDAVDEEHKDDAQLAAAQAWFSTSGGVGRPGTMVKELVDELVEDTLVCGAVALYPRPTKGGDIVSVEPIDAATIIPKRDSKGWVPEPPSAAYEQKLRDGSAALKFTRDELLYHVWGSRTCSVWGQSFVESCMMSAMQFQAADKYNLVWFTDGDSVLGYWWYSAGDCTSEERELFRVWLKTQQNKASNKGKPLCDLMPPAGWKYESFRPRNEADYIATQKFLYQRIAPFFGLTPSALGFESDTYKASQAAQQEQAVATASRPIARFLEDVFNVILQEVLGFDQCQFVFDTDIIDQQRVANVIKSLGLERLTINQANEMLGLPKIKGGYADDLITILPTGQVLVLASTDPARQVIVEVPNANDVEDETGFGVEPDAGATALGKAGSDGGTRADLLRWRSKVRRASKEGKQPSQVKFQSEVIPVPVMDEIAKALSGGTGIDNAFAPHLQRGDFLSDLGRGLDGLTQHLEQLAIEKGITLR